MSCDIPNVGASVGGSSKCTMTIASGKYKDQLDSESILVISVVQIDVLATLLLLTQQ